MKSNVAIAASVAGCLMLSGCNDPAPKVGFVKAREYTAGYHTDDQRCISYATHTVTDKKGNRTTYTDGCSWWTTDHNWHPPVIRLVVSSNDKKEEGYYDVTQEQYDKYHEGDDFNAKDIGQG